MISIFRFPEYYYLDFNEILIYPERFDKDYLHSGNDGSILGMVREGNEMRSKMTLSFKILRKDFHNQLDGRDVAIHEFINFIDGDDRSIDGLTEALISNQHAIPFLKLIRDEMILIAENKSILDPCVGKNEAEFFAVMSEVFFENPDKLAKHHPELNQMLKQVFRLN